MLPFLRLSSPIQRLWENAESLIWFLFWRSSYILRYILFPLNLRLSFCSKSCLTVILHSFMKSMSNGNPEAGSVEWASLITLWSTFFWLFFALMISGSLIYGIDGLTNGKKQVMKNTSMKSWAPIILLPFLRLRRYLSGLQRWFRSRCEICSYIPSSRIAMLPSESSGRSSPLSCTLSRFYRYSSRMFYEAIPTYSSVSPIGWLSWFSSLIDSLILLIAWVVSWVILSWQTMSERLIKPSKLSLDRWLIR